MASSFNAAQPFEGSTSKKRRIDNSDPIKRVAVVMVDDTIELEVNELETCQRTSRELYEALVALERDHRNMTTFIHSYDEADMFGEDPNDPYWVVLGSIIPKAPRKPTTEDMLNKKQKAIYDFHQAMHKHFYFAADQWKINRDAQTVNNPVITFVIKKMAFKEHVVVLDKWGDE